MIAVTHVTILKTNPAGVRNVFEQSGRANCQIARHIRVHPTVRIAGNRASTLRKIWRQILAMRTSDPR
jgi:hypothetical protein